MSNRSPVQRDAFRDRTMYHLISEEILADPYEAAVGIDAIGAAFEALARRAEKDDRIGQFFTTEAAVTAATAMAGLRPTDRVADPACGTGRFLIQAMHDMLSKADGIAGVSEATAVEAIKRDRLVGTDIDAWLVTIAKMNMYIHGDGKTNIRQENGLTLNTLDTCEAGRIAVDEDLDVVLTNPPLGDVNFVEIAEALERGGKTDAPDWSRETFAVVPHQVEEEAALERAEQKIQQWRTKLAEAEAEGAGKRATKAEKYVAEWETKRSDLERRIGAGEVQHVPAGAHAKGGALFLSAVANYLSPVREPSWPTEWRGGLLSIVLDEAILNTPDYADARAFLCERFFVKAMVSVPRDAFKEPGEDDSEDVDRGPDA